MTVISALTLVGCTGAQSALDPAGPQAGRIGWLWWLMFYVCAAVFLLVIAALALGLRHARQRPAELSPAPVLNPSPETERRMITVVVGAVAATTLILFVLLVASFRTGRAISDLPDPQPLTIKVTGHQWWWEVNYDDPMPSRSFTTANEIHIPVGRPVMLRLNSTDVIHSLWVPNLHGKKDLIPGHETVTWFQADRPGVYRGQCAEFCGHQHAHMALAVVAEPAEQFSAWYDAQSKPPPPPSEPAQQRGLEVFLSAPCVMCHTIQGTGAASNIGPNLTHLASRRTIGAGTLENNRGNRAGWVVNSQEIKPGNRMPPNILSPEDLQALLSYLESLK